MGSLTRLHLSVTSVTSAEWQCEPGGNWQQTWSYLLLCCTQVHLAHSGCEPGNLFHCTWPALAENLKNLDISFSAPGSQWLQTWKSPPLHQADIGCDPAKPIQGRHFRCRTHGSYLWTWNPDEGNILDSLHWSKNLCWHKIQLCEKAPKIDLRWSTGPFKDK